MSNYSSQKAHEAENISGIKGYFSILHEYWMDVVKLNILFIMCCIPVFTIPAAVTAMCRVIASMLRRERYTLLKLFFSSFRSEVFASLPIGLFTGAGMAVGAFGLIFTRGAENIGIAAGNVTQAICVLLFFSSLNIGIYAFQMKASLELPVSAILKNSVLLLIIGFKQNLLADVLAAAICALMVLGLPFDLPLVICGFFSLLSLTLSYVTRHGIRACIR